MSIPKNCKSRFVLTWRWSEWSVDMHSFPQELIDSVFLFLDKPTLSACTTVCQRWLASARPALFRTIIILHETKKHNIDSFIAYLKSDYSLNMAKYIKKLLIRGDRQTRFTFGFVRLTASHLDVALKMLPSVHSLQMSHVSLSSCKSELQGWKLPRPMKNLSLTRVYFELPMAPVDPTDDSITSSCSLVELFNLFSSVSVLRLSGLEVDWRRDSVFGTEARLAAAQAAGQRISKFFDVKTFIQKRHAWVDEIVFKLLNCSPNGLSTLLSKEVDDHIFAANHVVPVIGPNLNHFGIRFGYLEDRDNAVRSSFSILHMSPLSDSRTLALL